MSFVVGQWVECVVCDGSVLKVGGVYRVAELFADGCLSLLEYAGSGYAWDQERFRPFVWQVGKAYRTTLEGVTGKVLSIDDEGDIYGDVYTTSPVITSNYWHAKTGKDFNEQRGADLLPFLADQPSEPKPTLTERYTVEHNGGPWWLLRDNHRGKVLPFATRELAEHVLKLAKSWAGRPMT